MTDSTIRMRISFIDTDSSSQGGRDYAALLSAMRGQGATDPRVLPMGGAGSRDPAAMVEGFTTILTTLSSPEVIAAVLAVVVAHLLSSREKGPHPIKAVIQIGPRYFEVSGSTIEDVEKEVKRIKDQLRPTLEVPSDPSQIQT